MRFGSDLVAVDARALGAVAEKEDEKEEVEEEEAPE